MDPTELLASQFETHRTRLKAVAYRMLGSTLEADDAVQEAWLRVSRAGSEGVDNLGGWLTTVVSRVCIDLLRARRARGEESLELPDPAPLHSPERTPEEDALLADSVEQALLVVLDTLEPAERVAFVLHDMFDLQFDEIAPIVDRTPVATRQLASRARRRVRGAQASGVDRAHGREIAEAFVAAAKRGDLEALMAILDPDVVTRADALARRMGGAAAESRGAAPVAAAFNGRAQGAVVGLIDGEVGLLVPVKGRMLLVLELKFGGGKITGINVVADRDMLAAMELTTLEGGDPLMGSRPGVS